MSSDRDYAFKVPSLRRCVTGDFEPKVEMHGARQLVVTIPVPSLTSSPISPRRNTDALRRIVIAVQKMTGGLEAKPKANDFLDELADRFDSVLDAYAHDHSHVFGGQHACAPVAEKPLRTKPAQETIGVHSSVVFHHFIVEQARGAKSSKADFARLCFDLGMEEFDGRLWTERSAVVLKDFQDTLRSVDENRKEQWSLRLPRKKFLKAISMATEYEMSRSQFALLCVVRGCMRHDGASFEERFQRVGIGTEAVNAMG
jgi:hypothetical protein